MKEREKFLTSLSKILEVKKIKETDKFDSFKEALHFANEDPYNKAGLFQDTIIKRFRQIFPTEVG